jgi:hypothetical protein
MNKETMKRWVPYVATGAGMLLLGLILGATLFGGDPEPCVEMSKPAMVEAFSAPAESAAPAAKKKPARPRAESRADSTGGGGGHF